MKFNCDKVGLVNEEEKRERTKAGIPRIHLFLRSDLKNGSFLDELVEKRQENNHVCFNVTLMHKND